MVGKQSKKMYSIDNLAGTYDDLTVWINELLTSDRQQITRYELINYLNTKGRVPLAIMKKNKPPKQPRCIARILKDHSQCKNESDNNLFCKIHTIRPPKYTTEQSIELIEQLIEQQKLNKKQQKKSSPKTPKTKPTSPPTTPKTPKTKPTTSPKTPTTTPKTPTTKPKSKNPSPPATPTKPKQKNKKTPVTDLEFNYEPDDNYEDIDFGEF